MKKDYTFRRMILLLLSHSLIIHDWFYIPVPLVAEIWISKGVMVKIVYVLSILCLLVSAMQRFFYKTRDKFCLAAIVGFYITWGIEVQGTAFCSGLFFSFLFHICAVYYLRRILFDYLDHYEQYKKYV